MSQITFLSTSLPVLKWGQQPELSFSELQDLLRNNLSHTDLEKVVVLQRVIDIENMRSLWKGEELNPKGSLNSKELEEAIVTRQGLPDYINDFLDDYRSKENRLKFFQKLVVEYFQEEGKKATGFLKEYLDFERKLRISLTALRAKELHRNLIDEMQFEDKDNAFIRDVIAQKDAVHFEPEAPFDRLVPMYNKGKDMPFAFFQDLAKWRFEVIDELLGVNTLSLDRVLGQVAKMITAFDFFDMNEQRGNLMIEKACSWESETND